jgi:site-specific recombinase XerC
MRYHPPFGVALPGQLPLFDQWHVVWSGGAAATWSGGPDPVGEGAVVARRRAGFWWRVGDLLSVDRVGLADALEVALFELAGVYAANERTSVKVLGEVSRFVRYADACGVEYLDELTSTHVEGYVWAATRRRGVVSDVSPRTAANRQAFVRRFVEVLAALGLWTGGDIVGAPIPRGLSEGSRPLTGDEMRLVEVYAGDGLFVSRRPLMVAFAQAGADAGEIASVTASDVDVSAGTVELGDDGNRRVNALTGWGAGIVAEHLAAAKMAAGPLCVTGGRPAHRAAHAVTVGLRETLVAAGIAQRRGVTARSIALTSAKLVLDRDGIIAAARFLGANSLDSTAASLDFDWQAR